MTVGGLEGAGQADQRPAHRIERGVGHQDPIRDRVIDERRGHAAEMHDPVDLQRRDALGQQLRKATAQIAVEVDQDMQPVGPDRVDAGGARLTFERAN